MDQPIIKFANDVAKSDVLNQLDLEENGLNNRQLKSKVIIINDEAEDQDHADAFNISAFFVNEVKRIYEKEVISNIIIKWDDIEGDDEAKWFIVKTLKISWEQSSESYMHVFVNTTHIKKLEKANATNHWQRVMFSSISHEFRTPINAFSNALTLLDKNNDEIEKFVRNQPMNRKNVQDSIKITDMNKKIY